jgi:hypothetical protein
MLSVCQPASEMGDILEYVSTCECRVCQTLVGQAAVADTLMQGGCVEAAPDSLDTVPIHSAAEVIDDDGESDTSEPIQEAIHERRQGTDTAAALINLEHLLHSLGGQIGADRDTIERATELYIGSIKEGLLGAKRKRSESPEA